MSGKEISKRSEKAPRTRRKVFCREAPWLFDNFDRKPEVIA
jgi:hypothetical protein